MILSEGYQTFKTPKYPSLKVKEDSEEEQEMETKSAMFWLLDVLAHPERATGHKVFKIDDEDLLSILKLKPRPGFKYSYSEFAPNLEALENRIQKAAELDEKSLARVDVKARRLGKKLAMFYVLIAEGMAATPNLDKGAIDAMENLFAQIKWYSHFVGSPMPLMMIAPETPEGEYTAFLLQPPNQWRNDKNAVALSNILQSWQRDDVRGFNDEVAGYRKSVADTLPTDTGKARFEAYYNYTSAFFLCCVLYLFVFALTASSWLAAPLGWFRAVNWSAFALALLCLVLHSWALGSRMYIQGRPPVTNLFSSAIFIGWAGVLLCLAIEIIFRNSIGNLVRLDRRCVDLDARHFRLGNGR